MLKVFEAFSGYGSQSLALKRLGVACEVVGISEIDKYAIKAYHALHGEVKNYGDISKIKAEDMPEHDLFTYSFPCQDISVAGNQAGLIEGQTRSGLLWECEKIIEAKKPKYLLMENVKNLVGKKFKADFDKWGEKLEQLGYTNYWKVLNAKDYGIPQNRERVFMISILGEHKPYEFPTGFDNGIRLRDILEDEVDEKYYISQEKCEKLISQLKDKEALLLDMSQAKREGKPREYKDYAPTLQGRDYKEPRLVNEYAILGGEQKNQALKTDGISTCLTSSMGTGGGYVPMVIPCLTPDRVEKRQNGRRFKEDGEPMFTLTGQDRHVVLQVGNYRDKETGFTNPQTGKVYSIEGCSPTLNTMQGGNRQPKVIVKEATKKGYAIAEVGDSINIEQPNSLTRRGRVGKQMANTLTCCCNQATLQSDWRIRKLTPKECFRLMGLKDNEISKIQETDISNSQQYKLAGNSIVVDVLEQLFSNLLSE